MVKIAQKENILALIKKANGKIKMIKGHNIVTNDGDEYYARKIIGDSSNISTPFYLRLGTGTDTPTKSDSDVKTYIDGSSKVVDDGFPKRNYADDDNSDGGVNVITYKITYNTGDVVANGISEGALVDDGDNPTKALNHFLFDEAFDLTSEDQLIVFVNHSFVGV